MSFIESKVLRLAEGLYLKNQKMKKILTFIIGLALSLPVFSQKSVAVYVTSTDGIAPETKRILGSELVSAITRTEDYIAVERTTEFVAQVSQERGNYEIDDAKLYDLGKKFGASNVCVADITKFGDEYYIVARLLDIKTSKVWRTSRKYSKLSSLRELVETSESLANELFGNTKELSTYANGDNKDNLTFITKIENRETYTKVTIKIVTIAPSQKIGISSETYIEDVSTSARYALINTSNINIVNRKESNYKTINKGIWEYSLFFESLPEDVTNIMIIEPGGYEYKDIILKPYGNKNTFVFDDKAQQKYNELTGETHHSQKMTDAYEREADYNIIEPNTNRGTLIDVSKNKDNNALEHSVIRWYITSKPLGADVYWRVVSSTPDVKNTTRNFLGSTPYESTESMDIKGLNNNNAGNVQIEVSLEKDGYITQQKRFNLEQVIDQKEISTKFNLVKDE